MDTAAILGDAKDALIQWPDDFIKASYQQTA